MEKPVSAITLEALLVLDAIDRRGSYAAAAEQLNKVPSALSYIVQKLEEQLDVTLFQRQGRKSVLTAAGKHLLVQGRDILQAVDILATSTKTIATGWEPKIRIAIDTVITSEKLLCTVGTLLTNQANIEIDIREEVMAGAWEALIEDQVDLLIGAPPPVPQQKGIYARKFMTLESIFVVPPNHPLAKARQPVAMKRIAQHRNVVVHDSARSAIARTMGMINESRYLFVSSMEQKIQAQLQGIGCGYLPRHRIESYLSSGQLIQLEIEEPRPPLELYIAWKTANRGKGLQTLRELLFEQYNC